MMVIGSIIGLSTNMLWLLIPTYKCTKSYNCTNLIIFPIFLSGLAHALMAGTCWNGVYYLVQRKKIGIALGLQGSLLNLVSFAIPVLFGRLSDHSS